MHELTPEAEVALEKTIAVWSLMLKKDISKEVAMRQLFPEDYNKISCNCYLCEYTKPYIEPDSVNDEYNCDYCPAALACDEAFSPYNQHFRSDLKDRRKARKTIITLCEAALSSKE